MVDVLRQSREEGVVATPEAFALRSVRVLWCARNPVYRRVAHGVPEPFHRALWRRLGSDFSLKQSMGSREPENQRARRIRADI
jgi:hypothetical protein